MSKILMRKEVANLPSQLEPNCVYYVRVGEGFDIYLSDTTGKIAHQLNSNTEQLVNILTSLSVSVNEIQDTISNLDGGSSNTPSNVDTELRNLLLTKRDASVKWLKELSQKPSSYKISNQDFFLLTQISMNKEILTFIDDECSKVKGTSEDYLPGLFKFDKVKSIFTSRSEHFPKYGYELGWDYNDVEYGDYETLKTRLLDSSSLDLKNLRLCSTKLNKKDYLSLCWELLQKYPESIDLLKEFNLDWGHFHVFTGKDKFSDLSSVDLQILDNYVKYMLPVSSNFSLFSNLHTNIRQGIYERYFGSSKEFTDFVLSYNVSYSFTTGRYLLNGLDYWLINNYIDNRFPTPNEKPIINKHLRYLWSLPLDRFKSIVNQMKDKGRYQYNSNFDTSLVSVLFTSMPATGIWGLDGIHRANGNKVIKTLGELLSQETKNVINSNTSERSIRDYKNNILAVFELFEEDIFGFLKQDTPDRLEKINFLFNELDLSNNGFDGNVNTMCDHFWRMFYNHNYSPSLSLFLLYWADNELYLPLLEKLADSRSTKVINDIFNNIRSDQGYFARSSSNQDRSYNQYWILPWIVSGKLADIPEDVMSKFTSTNYPITYQLIQLAKTDKQAFQGAWVLNKLRTTIKYKTQLTQEEIRDLKSHPKFASIYSKLTIIEKLILGIERVIIPDNIKGQINFATNNTATFNPSGNYLSELKQFTYREDIPNSERKHLSIILDLGLISSKNFDFGLETLLNRELCRNNPNFFLLAAESVTEFYQEVKDNPSKWRKVTEGEHDGPVDISNFVIENSNNLRDKQIVIFYSLGTWSYSDKDKVACWARPILYDFKKDSDSYYSVSYNNNTELQPIVPSIQWARENSKEHNIVIDNKGTRMSSLEQRESGLSGVWNQDISAGEIGDAVIGYMVYEYIKDGEI